ncbi:MAG TPA: Bro-N domain-containing protein [Coxiellaceae bacterium]|nr:Bro-N domain-containing protein [Coxiellaceae bacterium]
METTLVVFKGKNIRRVFHQGEWWFSIIDIIESLTETARPRKYWSDLKNQLVNQEKSEVSEKIGQLKMKAADNKVRLTDAANTETLFRIIQSIPSPKAEPFKRWLAKVGYERVQEIENPELANQRMYYLYRAKGYSDVWIEKRLRGMALRDELTEEYKKFKHLKHENLRDHMTGLELIFTMLGEASTTEIAWHKNAEGFPENKEAAQEGGEVAGKARKDLEKRTGKKISTKQNYLKEIENITEEDSSY